MTSQKSQTIIEFDRLSKTLNSHIVLSLKICNKLEHDINIFLETI